MMVIRELTFHPIVFECLDEGVIFVGFFLYGNVREYVVPISEFDELYGVWWGWGYGVLAISWGTKDT